MSRLSERQRLLVTIAVSVLLTGGLVALILKDRSEIETVREEIGALDSRIRAADVEIRKTRNREDEVLVFRAVESRELAILPTRQRIATFHAGLSQSLLRAGLRFQNLPESKPVESHLAKGIFVTRNVMSYEGDAASTLKFVNEIESDPRLVAVKGLKIAAGQRERGEVAGPILHDVEMHLETYFYNPASAGMERVHIPGAEARLQEPEIREKIAAFQPERPDTYILRPSASRRDPLVDPRQARQGVDVEGLEEARRQQEEIVFDLEADMNAINERIEQEHALGVTNQLFRRDRLAKEVNGLLNELRVRLEQVTHSKSVAFPDLMGRVQAMDVRLEEIAGKRPTQTTVVTRSIAQERLDAIRELLESGQYTEVASLVSEWSRFVQDKEVEEGAKDILLEIQFLRERSKTLSEFHSMLPRVTGTIVHPVDPERSVALVNGRPMHLGELLEGKSGISIAGIEREAVVFAYRGESIRVRRGRGANEDKPRGLGERHPTSGAR